MKFQWSSLNVMAWVILHNCRDDKNHSYFDNIDTALYSTVQCMRILCFIYKSEILLKWKQKRTDHIYSMCVFGVVSAFRCCAKFPLKIVLLMAMMITNWQCHWETEKNLFTMLLSFCYPFISVRIDLCGK